MTVNFKTYPNDQALAAKVTTIRRAQGQILTILRDLDKEGITVDSIDVRSKTITEGQTTRTLNIDCELTTTI